MSSVTYRLAIATLLLALATVGVVAYQRYGEFTSRLNACEESLHLALRELKDLRNYSELLYLNCTALRESYLQLRNYTESLLASCSAIEEAYLSTSKELQSVYIELSSCRDLYQKLSEDFSRLSGEYENVTHRLEVLMESVPVLVTLHQYFLQASIANFSYFNETLTVTSVSSFRVAEVSSLKRQRYGEVNLYLATPKLGFVELKLEVSDGGCFRVEAVNVYYVANYSSRTPYYSGEYCGYHITILIPVLPHQTLLRVIPYHREIYEQEVRYLAILGS